MTQTNEQFTFEISLSVLNHLGRNLYRSFMTVLGEAISNSWDADAQNVWVYIDREKSTLVIKDDGLGMDSRDFQSKFLKIGYSKRKDGTVETHRGRPFIGRKGIGKLALLSCAEKITILSKTKDGQYVGGVIDNSGLSKAIKDDLTPSEYLLGTPNVAMLENYMVEHENGTILFFQGLNEGIKNSVEYIKKLIALHFRFSLLDTSFTIFVNDDKITLDHLSDLAGKTQLAWVINDLDDPYVSQKLIGNEHLKFNDAIVLDYPIRGFIASVKKPRDLKVFSTDEKASVDLFVNGRLREKDLLKHISRASVVESYLYGQIHFDKLDGEIDRFTSSREGIVADDPKFRELLDYLVVVLSRVLDDWDKWRIALREDGDPENNRISKKERKSRELYTAVSKEYSPPKESKNKAQIDKWVDDLADDAQFNFSSYAECFISENLMRNLIEDEGIELSPEAGKVIERWKKREEDAKNAANMSIDIYKSPGDLSYLSMDDLANLVDKVGDKTKDAGLSRDAIEYKPIRNALAHTALLSDLAKKRLTVTYENIKARLKNLLSET